MKNGYSLYVGIPFCPSVCSYCSFSSGPLDRWKEKVDVYVDTLCKELEFIAERSKNKKLNTIYIGGGTPTTLTAEQLERLMGWIDEKFSREHLLEVYCRSRKTRQHNRRKIKGHERATALPGFPSIRRACSRRHWMRSEESIP